MSKVISISKCATIVLAVSAITACSKEAPKSTPAPTKAAVSQPVSTAAPAPAVELTLEQKGKKLFSRCRACHTLNDGGKNKVGPNLWQVFGRTVGTTEGFAYSKAMIASEIIWTEETVGAYLENPRKYLPKNKMAFPGLRKAADREAMIAYLQENTK